MRFVRVLLIVTALLSLTICLSTDLKAGQEPLSLTMASFDLETLKAKHGTERSFSHKETRSLYHSLLKEVETTVASLPERYTESERAIVCSTMRANARKYSRLRDALGGTSLVLQVRDSYIHAVRFLPHSLRRDVTETLRSGKPTLSRTAMTVKQALVCLAPHLTGGECPSYAFLKDVRGKADKDILKTCVRTNKGYDTSLSS